MSKLSETMVKALRQFAEEGHFQGFTAPTVKALDARGMIRTTPESDTYVTDAGKEALALNGGWVQQGESNDSAPDVLRVVPNRRDRRSAQRAQRGLSRFIARTRDSRVKQWGAA